MQIETIDTSTVVHAVAKDQNKFLLVKEKNDRWYIPSGKLEKGERLIDAIIREVREETGAECVPVGIFKLFHHYLGSDYQTEDGKLINRVHYFFEVKITSAIVKGPNEHTNGAGWFTREEVHQLSSLTPLLFEHLNDFDNCKMRKSVLPMEFIFTKPSE